MKVKQLKQEIRFYKSILSDSKTPKASKILLSIAIFYLFLPFDLIPDFIPILGQLDDLVIIPLLFYLAIRMVPSDIQEKYKPVSS